MSTSLLLAFTITGTFIGAGFVSGQELWQFFGSFGIYGIIGFMLSVSGIVLFSYLTLSYAQKTRKNTFDKIISINDNPNVKKIVCLFEIVFYLCVYIIMVAGIESLAYNFWGTKNIYSGIIFVTIVSIISLIGIKGVITAFSAIIPVLVIFVFLISTIAIIKFNVHIPKSQVSNSLLSNCFFSPLVYLSYNFFGAIGVFGSLSMKVKSNSELKKASIITWVVMMLLGLPIIISCFTVEIGDMPMLSVASSIGIVYKYLYGILLTLAMLGASVSSLFPLVELFRTSLKKSTLFTISATVLLSAITVLCSLIGFTELIGVVYPIFGYVGFIIIFILIYNLIKEKNKKINY